MCGIFRYMCHTYSLFSRGTRASRRGTRAGRVAILYGVRSVARARHCRLSPMPLQNAHAGHDCRPRRRRGPLSAQRSHRVRSRIIVSIAATTPSPQASIGSRGASRTAARDDDSAPPPLPLTPPCASRSTIASGHYLEEDGGLKNVHSDVAVAQGLGGALRNESRAHRRRRRRRKRTREPMQPLSRH